MAKPFPRRTIGDNDRINRDRTRRPSLVSKFDTAQANALRLYDELVAAQAEVVKAQREASRIGQAYDQAVLQSREVRREIMAATPEMRFVAEIADARANPQRDEAHTGRQGSEG